ncbi:hypothetical protein C8J57DRAFT_244890 [Mycena rebaudengoi]|nr:hypothetical protein C8J57DRAFT_244890 [Mycena rebaudengoi]
MGLLDDTLAQQVSLFLGPWLIGAWFEILLQGVLFCQFVNYFSWYRDDKQGLKLSVAVLALLTILKSCQAFVVVWINFVEYFGDLRGAVFLNFTAWWQAGNTLMAALIGLLVQAYFCWRLYAISKKWWIAAPIMALVVFSFVGIIVSYDYSTTRPDDPIIGVWMTVHLAIVCAADFLITLSTAFFLIRSKKNILPQTVGLINSLVRLTFQTAAPAALCALLNVLVLETSKKPTLSIIFNMPLPKLYAISMMWTLNARRALVQRSRGGTHTGSSTNEISGGRSRPTRRGPNGDVELGAIKVLTQTETTKHIDVMFDPTHVDNDSKGRFAHHQVDNDHESSTTSR